MRKNGFTLIELLAVIVILAIIALIATPIILNIINDAREKANERSVELYASAVRNGIVAYQLREGKTVLPGTYTKETLPFDVEYDGKVECTSIILAEDGKVSLDKCTVNGGEKEYSYGIDNSSVVKVCELSDEDSNGKYSVGDIVTCSFKESTEQFYVIENEDEDTTEGISMLSMYNLYVGNVTNAESLHSTPLENPTGIQSPLAKGDCSDSTWYGVVGFESYFDDEDGNLLPQYSSGWVYDENSSFYPYVNAYETYLKDNGVSSASATLISYEQVNDLKTNKGNPNWLYNTSYWTGTAIGVWSYMWIVDIYGYISDSSGDTTVDFAYGIRPLITISISEIQ